MNIKIIYLLLSILGALLPLSYFLPWVITNGLDVSLFIQELFSTAIGGFFAWDVIISAIALLVFIAVEGRRSQMKHCWLPVVGTLGVGVSFGLPLFLYMRQRHAEKIAGKAG